MSTQTAKDFFESGKRRLGERFSDEGTVQECWKIIESLYHDPLTNRSFNDYSVDELTSIAGRISLLKVYIGQLASEANLQTNNAYIFKSFQRSGRRKQATTRIQERAEKVTQASIDAEVVQLTVLEEQDWAFAQGHADKMMNLFRSLEWVLSSIGWRIKELNSAKFDTKYYDQADTSELL